MILNKAKKLAKTVNSGVATLPNMIIKQEDKLRLTD